MNVLLTSIGRRAYMVKWFKELLGNSGEVHVCNSDEKNIAFKYADKKVISPLIYDADYITFLVNYCKKNEIHILISFFDIDLWMLAKHKSDFENVGTKVIVSDPEIIEICNDKWMTYKFLYKNGFDTPKTFLKMESVISEIEKGDLTYPIVVKPRYGCGSIAIGIANDEEELFYLTKRVNREIDNSYLKYESSVTEYKVIYQEYLLGQEYGGDIINDLNGNIQNVVIRKKIAMRSGETDIAELVDNPVVYDTLKRLGKVTKHIANMDCDIFLVGETPYILEMNARFGGGYPFSHMGGCNLPQAIINWCEKKEVPIQMITAKTGIIGFKEIHITEI